MRLFPTLCVAFGLLSPSVRTFADGDSRPVADTNAAILPVPSAPQGYHWKAITELWDEFNGEQLDLDKWLPYQPYWKGRIPSRFSTQNVMLRDGNLNLLSTPAVKSLTEVKDIEKDIWINSACISSKQPIALYGYYEARLKASNLPMTSSFWLQGKYSEIDVVEQFGNPFKDPKYSHYMMTNTHYFKDGWKNDKATPVRTKMATGAAEEFHSYGVWWKDEENLWFYCDGVKVAEAKTKGPFLEPMYLFFDTEVYTWPGLPTIEDLSDPTKNTMYVDWLHSWNLEKNK